MGVPRQEKQSTILRFGPLFDSVYDLCQLGVCWNYSNYCRWTWYYDQGRNSHQFLNANLFVSPETVLFGHYLNHMFPICFKLWKNPRGVAMSGSPSPYSSTSKALRARKQHVFSAEAWGAVDLQSIWCISLQMTMVYECLYALMYEMFVYVCLFVLCLYACMSVCMTDWFVWQFFMWLPWVLFDYYRSYLYKYIISKVYWIFVQPFGKAV